MDMGRGEERLRCMQRVTWKLTLPYVKQTKEFAVWLRKLKQGLCINLEGWDGEGDGMEGQERGDICTPMTESWRCLTENNKIPLSNYPSIKK